MAGPGYNGVAAMRGYLRGVQAVLRKPYPKALYVHYSAHTLNLVVSSVCFFQAFKYFLGTSSQICNCYRASPLRTKNLREKINRLLQDSQKQNVTGLCKTRWVECHDSVLPFLQLYQPILCSLEALEENRNIEMSAKASQILNVMNQSQFVMCPMS